MIQAGLESSHNELAATVLQLLARDDRDALATLVADVHPADAAQMLGSVPSASIDKLLSHLDTSQLRLVLPHLNDAFRARLVSDMEASQLAQLVESLDPSELALWLPDLPDTVFDSIVALLDADNLSRLHAVLDYPEDSVGRIMTLDALSVRPTATLGVVSRWLRKQSGLPPYTSALMVTDSAGKYLGTLPLSLIVTDDPSVSVESVMQISAEFIRAQASELDVARLFDQRHLVAVAVLDEQDVLLGRITVDHAMTILRKEAERVLLNSARLNDEADLFAPIVPSAKLRGVWLGINLVTVFLAAWVIGRFQSALDQLVALAVLMPIVASMGGIAGSQTLTLTIRGLALNQIVNGNVRWLATKELAVAILNGIVWAIVVALTTWLWFQNPGLSIVIAFALVLNLVVAAASGVAIPLILKRMGLDPALAGAVILTTVTDIVGFLSFLGLASVFLL